MFMDRLLNQGSGPALEKWLEFTDARQRVLAEDIVNVTTPEYIQKDLSLEKFQSMLSDKVEQQKTAAPGSVDFEEISSEIQNPQSGMLFHDGNNRSMEKLMTDEAKNALMHTLAVELLKSQLVRCRLALKERVS